VVFAAPVGPSAFPIILGNAVGDILFQGNLEGPGTGLGNDEALFIKSDSGTRLFIREGDPVPGMPGFAFREGSTAGFRSSDISFNDSGHVAIAARASGSTGLVTAVLTDISGGLAPIVRSGDPAPGTNGQFAFVVGPVMNIRGDVAFLGSTESGSVPPVGLWVHSNGGLRAVAIPGQALPGQPAGTVIQSIQSIRGFGDDGLVLFVAVLTVPGGLSSTALLVADPAGQISVVARTGAMLDVGGDVRTVTEVAVRPDALSDDSHAAFAVVFSDGSGAEFLAAVGSSCYANCDGSASVPVLNVNDFTCFLNRFGAGEPYANCDGSTAAPVLNVNDFVCFLGKFAAGCP
jgi:hypothetical protein